MNNSIHKFRQLNMLIVLDPVSGAIHVVDNITYEILDYFEKNKLDDIVNLLRYKFSEEDIIDAYNEISALKKQGLLFTEDKYRNLAINRTNSVIKALCLNVAHDCNLRCRYCFASTGDFKGGRKLMSYDVGKKAIDFLIKGSGNRKVVEVDFFGGEPLMNFDVIKKLVDYGRKQSAQFGKTIKYTITTNGVLLDDDKIKYLNENFSNVVLSLDGRKEVNDMMRKRVDNSGSYDVIAPKIKKFVNIRGNREYYVRGTYTAQNLDFTNDVLHIADMGINEVSVEPVVEKDKTDYALNENHLETILREYDKLAEEYIKRIDEGRPFSFYHFKISLDNGPCIRKRLQGCGAGFEYVAITPDGDIYPCHQFVGNDEYKLGNLNTGIVNTALQKLFLDSDIYKRKECSECWARFYCSGGCYANNYNINGDINKPYKLACEMQKKRFECAIAIKIYQIMKGDKDDKELWRNTASN